MTVIVYLSLNFYLGCLSGEHQHRLPSPPSRACRSGPCQAGHPDVRQFAISPGRGRERGACQTRLPPSDGEQSSLSRCRVTGAPSPDSLHSSEETFGKFCKSSYLMCFGENLALKQK